MNGLSLQWTSYDFGYNDFCPSIAGFSCGEIYGYASLGPGIGFQAYLADYYKSS